MTPSFCKGSRDLIKSKANPLNQEFVLFRSMVLFCVLATLWMLMKGKMVESVFPLGKFKQDSCLMYVDGVLAFMCAPVNLCVCICAYVCCVLSNECSEPRNDPPGRRKWEGLQVLS
jgi:hypothetical protein